MVGFEKIGQKQADLEKLSVVSLVGGNVASLADAGAVANIRELNLRDTLVWNWREISALALPYLTALNLSETHLDWSTFEGDALKKGLGQTLKKIALDQVPELDWKKVTSVVESLPLLECLHITDNKVQLMELQMSLDVFADHRDRQ